MPNKSIIVKGARQHNLKNFDVEIPKHKLVVITGPSGCGKSSLAFHTVYAEAQSRFMESLSSNARQYLDQLEKPDVTSITGLSPAIAIEQNTSHLSASTVAQVVDIYNYLRVLWAAIGVPHDPVTGEKLTRMSAADITQNLLEKTNAKLILLAPVPASELHDFSALLTNLRRQGFIRVRADGELLEIEQAEKLEAVPHQVEVVVDRLVIREDSASRLADSVETCLRLCGIETKALTQESGEEEWQEHHFLTSFRNPKTGFTISALTPSHFSPHHHLGACPTCSGKGEGCPTCHGKKLNAAVLAVKIHDLSIADFCALSVEAAHAWLEKISLPQEQERLMAEVVKSILHRLHFLTEIGLAYLTLDRTSNTLSGGEAQRLRLSSALGAGLSGVLYVLDEPSIGLHAADTERLIVLLKKLRDLGNTVLIVEHDEDIIRAADWIIELGPGAGANGGNLLGAGEIHAISNLPTGKWLEQKRTLTASTISSEKFLHVKNVSLHNLKNFSVKIPLHRIVTLTGVGGSGKSTLAHDVICDPSFQDSEHVIFDESITRIITVDQSPIGRSPRSNPATFTGIFEHIRTLFTQLPAAKQRGYTASRFSFNNKGGRCERCQGNGRIKIEMHFMPDAWIPCTACDGKRFNRETLEVRYKGHSIADILDLTISQASALFTHHRKIIPTLKILSELGLDYLTLGQAAHTLSGGEAQRLKLAQELAKPPTEHALYLLDEPTTGLHFSDVEKLLTALRKIRDARHSILLIEHNLDVIAASDYIIDLGLGGGIHGGKLIAQGTPQEILHHKTSLTAKALRNWIKE